MSRLIFSAALMLAIAIGAWGATLSTALATGPFETTGNVRWIVFASRQNVDEAIGLARRFGSEFGQPAVMSTTNGWYAVAVGPVSVARPGCNEEKARGLLVAPEGRFSGKGANLYR